MSEALPLASLVLYLPVTPSVTMLHALYIDKWKIITTK